MMHKVRRSVLAALGTALLAAQWAASIHAQPVSVPARAASTPFLPGSIVALKVGGWSTDTLNQGLIDNVSRADGGRNMLTDTASVVFLQEYAMTSPTPTTGARAGVDAGAKSPPDHPCCTTARLTRVHKRKGGFRPDRLPRDRRIVGGLGVVDTSGLLDAPAQPAVEQRLFRPLIHAIRSPIHVSEFVDKRGENRPAPDSERARSNADLVRVCNALRAVFTHRRSVVDPDRAITQKVSQGASLREGLEILVGARHAFRDRASLRPRPPGHRSVSPRDSNPS